MINDINGMKSNESYISNWQQSTYYYSGVLINDNYIKRYKGDSEFLSIVNNINGINGVSDVGFEMINDLFKINQYI